MLDSLQKFPGEVLWFIAAYPEKVVLAILIFFLSGVLIAGKVRLGSFGWGWDLSKDKTPAGYWTFVAILGLVCLLGLVVEL